MSARLLDGRALAATHRARTARIASLFTTETGQKPGLAAVLVGDNPASASYVRGKVKACSEAGIHSEVIRLPATTTDDELFKVIDDLNNNPAINGILLQLPLPAHLPSQEFLAAIDPAKDVDGFHPVNMGLLMAGLPSLNPCTPTGCIQLIQTVQPDMTGLHAVVLGRSLIVGKPLAQLLLQQNCTVTTAHSKTRDLPALCQQADILVAAMGQPEIVKSSWIKPGAIVIDVGITRVNTKLVGDVAFEEASQVASAITPVPGGVGPMTIANLLANTVRAAYAQAGAALPTEFAA